MCNIADDDTQADMYLAAVEILRGKGYRQYEISNFARKGLYSRHNMKYWTGGEYLGFGPSASSDFAGKRFILIRDLHDLQGPAVFPLAGLSNLTLPPFPCIHLLQPQWPFIPQTRVVLDPNRAFAGAVPPA